jgi:fibronectin-binding autotransporter adhesin
VVLESAVGEFTVATINYSGGGIAGDWADPNNWAGGKVPAITDKALVLGGTSMTVGGPVSVNAIMVIEGGTDTFTGAVTTAGVGNCEGLMVCVGSTVVFAPGSSLKDGGDAASFPGGGVLQVGVGGIGNFVADGSSTLATTITSNDGTIGKLAAGIGTVTLNDSSWTTAEVLQVGLAGQGTLNVESGGKVTVGSSLVAGDETGSVGTLNVASGGQVKVADSLIVGGETGSTGTLDVAGGTVSAATLDVSIYGTGTLNVDAGSHINVASHFEIGSNVRGVGTATLFSGSTVTVAGSASIGSETMGSPLGTATLTIEGTSSFTAQNFLAVSDGSTVAMAGGMLSAGLTTGNVGVAAGSQIAGYGTLATRTGGTFMDAGKIVASGGTLQLNGNVTGPGSIIINPDSTVAITGASLISPTITFMSGVDETLSLAATATVRGIISGFSVGDQIQMAGTDTAIWNSRSDSLILSEAGKIVSALQFSGNYSGDVFSFTHTGNLGVITLHAGSF